MRTIWYYCNHLHVLNAIWLYAQLQIV